MRIAVNTRFGNYAYTEGYGRFVREITSRLPYLGQEDEFYFLSDQQGRQSENGNLKAEIFPEGDPGLRPKGHPPENNPESGIRNSESPQPSTHNPQPSTCNHLSFGPPARHPLLWAWWYNVAVPRQLNRIQADVFFSPDGICSLRAKQPQVLVIHDLAFMHQQGGLPAWQRRYYMRNTPKFIRKAARIITVSEFSREDIHRQYPESLGKVELVYNGVEDAFRPLSWEQREAVKARFASGMEYFVYVGSIHPRKNLMNLLKAFSIFKKRQRTQMKLVIVGRLAWKVESFKEQLSRFKFRDDVILTGFVERQELREILGGAYALVNPSLWEGFGMTIAEAMRSGVPVLCSGNHVFPEIAGDAALYFDPNSPEDIAKQLTRIYIQEAERSRLIEKGLTESQRFDWNRSAEQVYRILIAAAGRPLRQ